MRAAASIVLLLLGSADSVAPAASEQTAVPVYRCAGESGVVFSDRPCGAQAELIWLEPDRINGYLPPSVPAPALRDRAPKPRRPAGGPSRHGGGARSCDALRARVARLDARMRRGYSGSTGERLRDARRAARRALTDRGCH